MPVLEVALAAAAVLAIVVAIAAIPAPLALSPDEAAKVIREWLAGEAARADYDAFLTCEIVDPRVAAFRDEFLALLSLEFADQPPAFLTSRGIEMAEELAESLDRLGREASGNA